MAKPNRWLHLRHPRGFTDTQFEQFRAHCRTWTAYVRALLDNWSLLPLAGGGDTSTPVYEFFDPELSKDRTTVTLPLGGEQTLGSRAWIEDGCSKLLWQYFPLEFLIELEEGLTETLHQADGPQTTWRRALRSS